MPRHSMKRKSRSPCRHGRKKSLRRGCKAKPGPKRSRRSSRRSRRVRRKCSRGMRKGSRVCKRKPGPKRKRSRRSRKSKRRSRKSRRSRRKYRMGCYKMNDNYDFMALSAAKKAAKLASAGLKKGKELAAKAKKLKEQDDNV